MALSTFNFIYDEKTKKLFGFGAFKYNMKFSREPKEIQFFKNYEILNISSGESYSLILTRKGLFAMGSSRNMSLVWRQSDRISPEKILFFDDNEILQVACGSDHSLVFTLRGLFGFGQNKDGQLGFRKSEGNSFIQKIPNFFPDEIDQIHCGGNYSLVLTYNGLYSFGENQQGELGLDHMNENYDSPQKIEFFKDHQIQNIYCGGHHTFVLSSKGLFGFGVNLQGQLGLGHHRNDSGVKKIRFFQNHSIQKIACGGRHSLVLTSEALFSFGDLYHGQLGLGPLNSNYCDEPQKIKFFDSRFVLDIFCGFRHSLVLTLEGLYSFGQNHYGQLGLMLKDDQIFPQLVTNHHQFLLFNSFESQKIKRNRKAVCTLLLCTRKYCPDTVFSEDNLPLDLFKLLFVFSNLVKKI